MSNDPIQPPAPIQRDRATIEMMKLFDELTFRKRVARTFRGLSQPKNTGDYKFAKLQIQLLTGPILAFIIPLVCIGILLSIESTVKTRDASIAVELVDPTEMPDIEEPPPPPPEDQMQFEPIDTQFDAPADRFNPDQITEITSHEPLSPKPAEMNTVAIVRSPIVMRGIVGSRSPGQRGAAISEFGGSQAGEATVMRALRWLKSRQRDDGSWPGQATAMTGLALLTFLAHGETPNPECEEFGPTVERGIRYLVDNQNADGLFRSKDGNNYAHPIATYALCEAWTLTKVPMLKQAAEKALGHLTRGQHPNGGWDYNMRQSERDDVSYGGWCAQAIKAGQMAGDLEVENLDKVYKNAVNGFKINAHHSGGFGYTSPGRRGLTGVGVLCMQLLGAGNDIDVKNALAFLSECTYSFEEWEKQPYGAQRAPVYYWYYITQAKFHAGRNQWSEWNRIFQPELIKRQIIVKDAYKDHNGKVQDIGYWDSPSEKEYYGPGGGESGTAIRYEKGSPMEIPTSDGKRVQDTTLCAMQLMVYYRYLPTFQTPEAVEDTDVADEEEDIKIKITM